MVRSIRASLDYYTRQFGPYPYRHLSLVEYPGAGAGIHAEPGMLIYEEGFSRWDPQDEPGSLDLPFAVMAHEVAHQWTVPFAFVEGAPVLSESVAWYYAIKVVERAGRGTRAAWCRSRGSGWTARSIRRVRHSSRRKPARVSRAATRRSSLRTGTNRAGLTPAPRVN